MPRLFPRLFGMLLAVLSVSFLSAAGPAQVDAEQISILDDARALLEKGQYQSVIELLEGRFPRPPAAVVQLLCVAYRGRARELLQQGEPGRARTLIVRLRQYERILNGADARELVAQADTAPPIASGPQKSPAPKRSQADTAQDPADTRPSNTATDTAAADGWRPAGSTSSPPMRTRPASATRTQAASGLSRQPARARPELQHTATRLKAEGDAAFASQAYDEALDRYTAAYRQDPSIFDAVAIRRWCYCRLRAAVAVINRGPRNEVEWSLTEQEVRDVLALLEKHSTGADDRLLNYARFLLRVASSRQAPGQKSPDMIRAAEPEEHQQRNGRTRAHYPGFGVLAPFKSDETQISGRSAGFHGVPPRASFLVTGTDATTAAKLLAELEELRGAVARSLFGGGSIPRWPTPCVVVVHSGRTTHTVPSGTPAVTTVERRAGRIVACRIDLYNLPERSRRSILSHEIAHVWLAAASPDRPLPRWADEGIAVLVEPPDKYRAHLASLRNIADLELEALERPSDYPQAVFYAMSATLADFVRSRYGMEALLQFAQVADERGIDEAARTVLGLHNIQHHWQVHVQQQLLALRPQAAANLR